VKSGKNIGKKNARHENVSLRKGGERKTGVQHRRVRHDAKKTGEKVEIKQNAVRLRGG
jgi:hypothetical protein